MSYTPSWKSGDWIAICDRCGFKFKASELRKTWEGYMVCEKDWESRHPQDFIRSKPETQSVPWTRPESADVFIGPAFNCTGATFVEMTRDGLLGIRTIHKARVRGPAQIPDTITVVCTLEVY